MEIRTFKSKEDLAEAFSLFFKSVLQSDAKTNVALSGGSTPKLIFNYMAQHFGEEVDWNLVNLYWVDERCVPPSDAQSNYKMTVDHLLSKIAIPEKNIFRMKGEADPVEEANRYGELLQKGLELVNDIPVFDVILLGMGDDGHTASIFPQEIDLWNSNKNCEVATHPDSGQKRITLTGKVINNAESVVFLVTGENKAVKVREVTRKQGDYKNYPASLVNPNTPNLIWFLDQDAAKELN